MAHPTGDTRQYVEVTPSTDQLDPTTVTTHCKRLHALGWTDPNYPWQSPSPPTFEVLLVSREKNHLSYLLGVDNPGVHEGLERTLRGAFPTSYELDTTHFPEDYPASFLSAAEFTAIEYRARPDRRHDWQLPFTFFGAAFSENTIRLPLGGIAETMAARPEPAIVQVLLQPKPDWSPSRRDRMTSLRAGQDTIGHQFWNALTGRPEEYTPTSDEAKRLDLLEKATPAHSFTVNARVLTTADPRTISDLTTAFDGIDQEAYRIDPTVTTETEGATLLEDVRHRRVRSNPRSRFHRLRSTARTPGIVVGAPALGSFYFLGGDSLPQQASRAVDPTRGERHAATIPSQSTLEPYTGDGLELGVPLSQDRKQLDTPLTLPPSLQRLHLAWFGRTGSGKSSSLTKAILQNQQATDGVDVLVDPKGDGMCETYLRAHLAEHGSLEDVYHFDCTELLPALSFFDVRPAVNAGMRRDEAVQDVVDHYEELLIAAMGDDRYHQAVRSPDIIRYLVKAQFDPVHGFDAFAHRDLEYATQEYHAGQNPPPISDPELQRKLEGIARTASRSFDELLHGVTNRIEKLSDDPRLRQIVNHVPQSVVGAPSTDSETSKQATHGTHLDFLDLLDEDVVILLDTGGLRAESRRVLTLLVLSKLWTALQRRQRLASESTSQVDDLPLVNLYLEEAADVAQSGIVTDLLSQSRSFGLSVTLAMQFPGQLAASDTEAYSEVLNNVGTLVVGNVGEDRRLARRLATDAMDWEAVGARLRRLERGEWLVSLPGEFGSAPPRPFQLHSGPLPKGHPEGDRPLGETLERVFPDLVDEVRSRTAHEYGVSLTDTADAGDERSKTQQDATRTSHSMTLRMDSTLPHTTSLPKPVSYNESAHTLLCSDCSSRYDPTIQGFKRAAECCASLEQVDREKVPICDVPVKLSPRERRESELTDRQLLFLQLVLSAAQGRFDVDWEFDICQDSMVTLRKYAGIDTDAVETLIEEGYLRKDCTLPHLLYSVTKKGRHEINEPHREGTTYGHLRGDLNESSEHRLWVTLGAQYLQQSFVECAESAATTVQTYYESDDHRLDAVALNDAGEIVVAMEAERSPVKDVAGAIDDFDAMADHDLEAAIWVVRNREATHQLLNGLYEPPSGARRIEKTYSEGTNPRKFTFDTAGLTDVLTRQMIQADLVRVARWGSRSRQRHGP